MFRYELQNQEYFLKRRNLPTPKFELLGNVILSNLINVVYHLYQKKLLWQFISVAVIHL